MDVKDVSAVKAVKESTTDTTQTSRRSARELSAEKVNIARTESVSVEVNAKPNKLQSTRDRANEVISALNVISDSTEEIDKIVTSLAGLAEQASQPELADTRRQILDQEARDLVQAIEEKVGVETSPGIQPLKGDPLKVEIEEELGKALEVILPDTSPEISGLSSISLSPADRIIQTRQTISEARAQLEELRSLVSESKERVSTKLAEVDVAEENQRASEANVRDVDSALQLTNDIQSLLSDSSVDTALNTNDIDQESVRRLTTE